MKFENIGIIGAGPNCVFTLDILIKKFLKINQITSRLKLLFMKKSGNFGSGNVHSKNCTKTYF